MWLQRWRHPGVSIKMRPCQELNAPTLERPKRQTKCTVRALRTPQTAHAILLRRPWSPHNPWLRLRGCVRGSSFWRDLCHSQGLHRNRELKASAAAHSCGPPVTWRFRDMPRTCPGHAKMWSQNNIDKSTDKQHRHAPEMPRRCPGHQIHIIRQ